MFRQLTDDATVCHNQLVLPKRSKKLAITQPTLNLLGRHVDMVQVQCTPLSLSVLPSFSNGDYLPLRYTLHTQTHTQTYTHTHTHMHTHTHTHAHIRNTVVKSKYKASRKVRLYTIRINNSNGFREHEMDKVLLSNIALTNSLR